MQVSIIIVNYNTKQLLKNCLNSIYRNTEEITYEIIVVDNASVDDSREMLENEFSSVIPVFSESNLGFGKANNLGAKSAKGEYLFFLNSDTLLKNNAVKIFFDFMIAYEKKLTIGALGCQLVDGEGDISHSYGVLPTLNSEIKYLLSKIGLLKTKEAYNEKSSYFSVEYVSGADLFMNKRVFETSGGFDPNFFMYYEESDLQKRLLDLHYKNFIIVTPQIIHLERGSAEKTYKISPNTLCFSQESLNYYMRKHFNGINYFLFRIYNIIERIAFLPSRKFNKKDNIKYLKTILFK